MKKVMFVLGTRPEGIKVCPVINEIRKHSGFEVKVCVTGQHKEMLQPILDSFAVIPTHDLQVMKEGQTLFDVTSVVLERVKPILEQEDPDIVLVQGDTTTAFATALACFYLRIPIGHIEAGFRTYNRFSPYPEEFNRTAIGFMADLHFAPTQLARQNLIDEHRDSETIFVVGNTAIDALWTTVREDYQHPILDWVAGDRLVLLTTHRRENLGQPMRNIFGAIRRVLDEHPDIKIVYPIHMNPMIRRIAREELSENRNLRIIEPLDVMDFHNLLSRSYLVLTDSGGIQGEAPSLGKPVLVLRDTTEYPEGIEAGTLKLVGTEEESIYQAFKSLLEDQEAYSRMAKAENPYGDGHSSERIVDIIEKKLLYTA